MTADTRTLADRIEADIAARATERVDAALAEARDVAFRAYAMALRASCGIPFEVVIADVMAKAEQSLRDAAVLATRRVETDNVLRRLAAHTGA